MSKYVRLVDVNKLEEDLKQLYDAQGWDYNELHFSFNDVVGNHWGRTVKAIPIDELFKFIDSRVVQPDGNVKYTEDITHLQAFISDWRMDNEEGYRDEVNRWWAEHSSRFD